MMTLQQASGWIKPARLVGFGADSSEVQIKRVHTDTRTLAAGDLFIALKGEKYDANDFLAAIALVNNAQREHLEFMATVEAVALENGSVITSLDAGGTAVFPADDDYTPVWKKLSGTRTVLTFAAPGSNLPGTSVSADVTASAKWSGNSWQVVAATPSGPLEFSLHIAGRHNVKNALAATACALAAGVSLPCIATGLSAFVPVKGRSRATVIPVQGQSVSLIDDTYNANPDSMRAAIDVLAELPGPRLLVMGDMGEVGDQGPQFHEEAGRYARERGIEKLFALGSQSVRAANSFASGQHFETVEALNSAVLAELSSLRSVLVKGSRFMKMERVVHAIDPSTQQKEGETHVA
jgi:UDP-N-acetylmuramoyl-tripeptide--D-alanyl-D-alanine ligase